ncbi:hypothetical protein P2H44_15730 [Albimonas sp. CAU 1670]|uniref:hypothetical protein n=1 Tax=Albimonas sp. CAU 1670 TaxID=3032599 RepID=UPI0023DAAE64|nr:hypothetical protein [Albimonas sp. CAU 1670]MDF2234010.1 hypothetical protein [Albimonas sp. CAU 1670]
MSRPLENRVDPSGEIRAVRARGTLMGNRGGRIHLAADPETGEGPRLGRRRWASRQWICCVLSFKGRRRQVMGPGYTELFFLDEATALAAGHRPCFECRRAEALAFAEAWADAHALPARPRAPEVDAILHPQRLGPRRRAEARALPDGAMLRLEEGPALKLADAALPWGWEGYAAPVPLPRGEVETLTPPAILGVLAAGWRPRLHPSAGA